jgi:uncharacterized protein
MNLQHWFRTSPLRYEIERYPYPGLANQVAEVVRMVFFDGKFLSLFSFLFAVGLAVQMERADARGARFSAFALRRLGVLLVLGAAHFVLLWMGDILHLYAVMGLVLLFLLRRKPKTIAVILIVLYSLPVVIGTGMAIVWFFRRAEPPPLPTAAELDVVRAELADAVHIYRDGSYLDIIRFRFTDFARSIGMGELLGSLQALTMFMFGLIVWRKGILRRPADHRGLLRKTIAIGVPFGVISRAITLLPREMFIEHGLYWIRPLLGAFSVAGMFALALAYGAIILLLLERPAARSFLSPLAPLGRMALTNYLLQSLICSFIFYSYGLALYDRLDEVAGAGIVIGIYAIQILFSRFWLRHYHFGPVEWLWRSLTYGKAQPMRL